MNLFPQEHKVFLKWAADIAFEMQSKSKGQIRISSNTLSAIMASKLPGTKPGFNINTLKASFDAAKTPKPAPVINNAQDASDLTAFLNCLKIDMTHAVYEYADKMVRLIVDGCCGENLYDLLNTEDELGEMYAEFHDIHDDCFKLANRWLPELDKDRLDEAFENYVPREPGQTFAYLQYKTVGYAYREFLKDTLHCFLEELVFHYDNMYEPSRMTDKQVSKWICESLDAWRGDEQFNPPADYNGFAVALDKVLGPTKYEYSVIVRAIIKSDDKFLQDYEIPQEWETYDYDVEDGDGTLRASAVVEIEASNSEEAVEQAQMYAPNLGLTYDQANVELWVDTDDEDDVIQGDKKARV